MSVSSFLCFSQATSLARLALGFLLVAVLAADASSAEAFCRMSANNLAGCCNPGDSGCTFVRWGRSCIGLGIDAGGSRDISANEVGVTVDAAFASWREIECGGVPSGFNIQRFREANECDRPEFNTDAGNINNIGFVDDWTARGNDPMAFAVTTVWNDTRSGQIFDVDMEINQERWTFTECPVNGCFDGRVDLRSVLTREAGHFFGLGFSDELGVTMSRGMIRGSTSARTLESDDALGFCAIYPEGAFGDCDFTPVGGFSTECGGSLGCCSIQDPNNAPADAGLVFLVAWYLRRRSRKRRDR